MRRGWARPGALVDAFSELGAEPSSIKRRPGPRRAGRLRAEGPGLASLPSGWRRSLGRPIRVSLFAEGGANPDLQSAHHLLIEPENIARPANRDQLHLAPLPWFKPHRCPRCDVQPHAACCFAIELQRGIGFGKVIVGADLNGMVAAVGTGSFDGHRPDDRTNLGAANQR